MLYTYYLYITRFFSYRLGAFKKNYLRITFASGWSFRRMLQTAICNTIAFITALYRFTISRYYTPSHFYAVR